MRAPSHLGNNFVTFQQVRKWWSRTYERTEIRTIIGKVRPGIWKYLHRNKHYTFYCINHKKFSLKKKNTTSKTVNKLMQIKRGVTTVKSRWAGDEDAEISLVSWWKCDATMMKARWWKYDGKIVDDDTITRHDAENVTSLLPFSTIAASCTIVGSTFTAFNFVSSRFHHTYIVHRVKGLVKRYYVTSLFLIKA